MSDADSLPEGARDYVVRAAALILDSLYRHDDRVMSPRKARDLANAIAVELYAAGFIDPVPF